MTLLQACAWLGSSSIGAAIRNSKWGFALIEMVHLLALALLGGTLLVSGLQSLGIIFKKSPPGAISRELRRARIASLAAMIVSGILLFADGPLRYYGNAAFRAKLLFIGGAALTGVLSHCFGSGSTQQQWPAAAKTATLLSLTLWLGAGVAGRVVGVL
jgi:hypothetical protein